MRLYDWAYENYALHDLSAEFRFAVPLVSGSRKSLAVAPADGSSAVLRRDGETELFVELPRFVFAPVRAGESAGTLTLRRGGRSVYECPLVYAESAQLADAY